MVNKTILLGSLGADPETRTTQSGMTVTKLRLATNERVKKGDTWEDHTEWHRVTCFGRTAENVAKYCKKGKTLFIEGHLRTTKYQKDGIDTYSTEVIADEVKFLGGGQREESGGGGAGPDDEVPF